MTTISHPGFTPRSFDLAVHKAHMIGLRIADHAGGIVFVTSATKPNRVYRVSRTVCTCEAHKRVGRCCHRAYAIFEHDCLGGACRPANVVPFRQRETPRPAA
jgi:hypothetical protein